MKIHSHIRLSVLETLAFFSLFSKRLTREEIIQYFYVDVDRGDFATYAREHRREILEGIDFVLHTTKWIGQDSHGYYLARTEYPTGEVEHFLTSEKLSERCKRFLPFVESTPFLRMVGIGNTLAFGAPEEKSDIDLFVISTKNNVWFTRIWMVGLLHVMGVRRHSTKVSGRFCLSFFVDEEELLLSKLAIGKDDVYMHFWIATLSPVLGIGMYHEFLRQNQDILTHHFPLWEQTEDRFLLPEKHGTLRAFFEFTFRLLWFIPEGCIWLQKKKMEKRPVPRGPNSDIVITDRVLKFHNNDRRAEYRTSWQETVTDYFGS